MLVEPVIKGLAISLFSFRNMTTNFIFARQMIPSLLFHIPSLYYSKVSTVAVPGIYNSPYLPYPTEVEMDLRNTKPSDHTKPKDARPKYNPTATSYDLPASRPKSLPPIHAKLQV